MSDPDRTAGLDYVLELVVLLGDDMARHLESEGLTPARAHLLWELLHRGPSTQRVLADALGVSARNVTGLVDSLVETGFVTREPHPTDRRATLVTFTDRGASTTEAMRDGRVELARMLFGAMSDDRYACLLSGLGEVLEILRSRLAGPRELPA